MLESSRIHCPVSDADPAISAGDDQQPCWKRRWLHNAFTIFQCRKKPAKATIEVQGIAVGIVTERQDDYICLTDIARFKDAERTDYLISNWMRNRNTIEFLGIWERLHNPAFNPIEFDGIRIQSGLNSFILTARQWIERTGTIGIVSKAGRYGGTYAHRDIAFEFAAWISVEFKLYLIK